METTSAIPSSSGAQAEPLATGPPQLALLDYFFPGFSMLSGTIQKYTHIDLNAYIPWFLFIGGIVFFSQYLSESLWAHLESHFMSTVDVRTDDEAYNMLMGWVAAQRFAQGARRFIVNTDLNSRSWFLWRSNDEDDEAGEDGEDANTESVDSKKKKKGFSYTPTFGSHYFWYKGRLLIFRRNQNRDQNSFMVVSEREEISICCFGRDPRILKELLLEARREYMKRDERKTLIYRGTTRAGSTEPTWQRCLARNSRPLSTVILNEKVKQSLIQDVTDYLNPNTRRWYSNRGIPYKRGYLLYGPAGCGKSSMALALAGHFEKMRIYIISLNSVTASEENLASLFAELPRRCVVLLEDIDTAGLTHTREEPKVLASPSADMTPGQVTPGLPVVANQPSGRLSLSGLLNILDGVASQEGRILIMTTNHLEKLDKALIRPGRVDMIVKFDRADKDMISAIFKAIFAPLEGDEAPVVPVATDKTPIDPDVEKRKAEEETRKREEVVARVSVLAEEFAEKVPAHEFSPAELQGYLLKKKSDPEAAVAGVEEWVAETRKDRKEKELKEAEDKRKAEEEAEKKKKEEEEEAAKKKKEEEESKEKEEKKQQRKEKKDKKKKKRDAKKKRKERRAKKEETDSESEGDSSSSSDSESGSASEAEAAPAKKKEKKLSAELVKDPEVVKVAEKVVEAAEIAESGKKGEGEGLLKAEEGKTGADSGYGTP